MGKRGYILLKANLNTLDENSINDRLWSLISQLEKIDGIEYVSNTVGDYDFVISVDTKENIEAISDLVKKSVPEWIEEVIPLTENSFFKKHRELKDLEIFNSMH